MKQNELDEIHTGALLEEKAMTSENKNIIETGIPGLSIKIGKDGVWVNIKSSTKKHCSFNLVNHANNNCARICKRAILDWCVDTMNQAKQAE